MNKCLTVLRRSILLFSLLSFVTGCATLTNPEDDRDPFQFYNRKFYSLNNSLDKIIAKPIARTYIRLFPRGLRKSIANIYDNISYVDVTLNDFLQGKFRSGTRDFGRLLVNSVVGIGGIFDFASDWGLEFHHEDFGQTLGVWGIGEGPYLVLPIIGPSTLRDAPGVAVSALANRFLVVSIFPSYSFQLGTLGLVNKRAGLFESSEAVEERSIDAYIFIREAYRQRRLFLIHDGNPPIDLFFDALEEDAEDF